jgi:predicted transposase YdaD
LEINAMLKVDDIRQTRVYREAQEEERQRQLEEKVLGIRSLRQLGLAPEQIAEALCLDLEFVRKEMANSSV